MIPSYEGIIFVTFTKVFLSLLFNIKVTKVYIYIRRYYEDRYPEFHYTSYMVSHFFIDR